MSPNGIFYGVMKYTLYTYTRRKVNEKMHASSFELINSFKNNDLEINLKKNKFICQH